MKNRTAALYMLLTVLFVVMGVFFWLLHEKKSEVMEENRYVAKIMTYVEEIEAYRKRYGDWTDVLKKLRPYCHVKETPDGWRVECYKLNEKKFTIVEGLLLRKNILLKTFTVRERKGYVDIFAKVVQ